VDGGIEWRTAATHLDATFFHTTIRDRVVSNVLLTNPPPPEPLVFTAVNTLAAHINGLDVDASRRLNAMLTVFGNATHYFSRREQLPTTGERNILNVPENTIRAGVDIDWRRLSSRVSGRYVQGRQDQDFTVAGSPVIDYPDFAVVDLSATYRLQSHHAVVVSINNLFDEFYYEKKGYPLSGIAWTASYRLKW
jgi:outer membrane cobalamin receptor